jgi:hypothetical protein
MGCKSEIDRIQVDESKYEIEVGAQKVLERNVQKIEIWVDFMYCVSLSEYFILSVMKTHFFYIKRYTS